jgi:GT2 family glycosyltransferase
MSSDRNQPLVSVITPSYNQAAYLEYTIRSVLSQDYAEIEYIVVDGGSTDGSLEIIQAYASKMAWWVSEPDDGQAAAVNKGLARAQGEVIAWLNSDDLYLPGTVLRAVRALQTYPEAGMVFGDAVTIDAGGRPIKELRFPDWGLEQLMGFRIICQPAVFMRRSALEMAGRLDPGYHYMLDHQLWLRIAKQSPVKHVQAIWAAARHHPTAKNVAQPLEFGRETLQLLDWMKSDPDLAALITRNARQVYAGANRLNARYLLDGGLPKQALKAYAEAFLAQPAFTLKHWHRILFAFVSLLGGGKLEKVFYRWRDARRPHFSFEAGIAEWPGLCLERRHS